MPYKPIEQYGVIGDLHTAVLIGIDGCIDWFCLPNFDSPSVFGAILDDKKGGHFKISSVDSTVQRQLYFPETNVLITRFSSNDGVARLVDFMPMEPLRGQQESRHTCTLIRSVTAVTGTVRLRLECFPAFNYARTSHKVVPTDGGVIFESEDGMRLGLSLPGPYDVRQDGVVSEFTLTSGESATFVLHMVDPGESGVISLGQQEGDDLISRTTEYWRRWLSRCNYEGRWREMVHRSVLTLKLLTYEPTGAIIASPTCSFPEEIGGSRNWDYRYTWLRDAAFTLYGFMRVGLTREAEQFMGWLEARTHETGEDGALQVVYGIDGRHDLTEEVLDHLDGYRGSRPVRIGNGAYKQLQLDIYGELMDSVYLFNKYGSPISYELWKELQRLLGWVQRHWREADEGIWEVRGGRKHFVYSKMMCWVALDRGLRLADKRSFPADREVWLKERDTIYEEIQRRGWSSRRKSFVQSFESDTLDASNLIMPLVFFMSPTDPRMLSTIDATIRELTHGSLVYRYKLDDEAVDGLMGQEGSFSMCTFWLVEALTRAGRLDEARFLFESMLGYANHLGLYGEEISRTGETLGNFPQAFTHLALISAAFNLDRALGKGI